MKPSILFALVTVINQNFPAEPPAIRAVRMGKLQKYTSEVLPQDESLNEVFIRLIENEYSSLFEYERTGGIIGPELNRAIRLLEAVLAGDSSRVRGIASQFLDKEKT